MQMSRTRDRADRPKPLEAALVAPGAIEPGPAGRGRKSLEAGRMAHAPDRSSTGLDLPRPRLDERGRPGGVGVGRTRRVLRRSVVSQFEIYLLASDGAVPLAVRVLFVHFRSLAVRIVRKGLHLGLHVCRRNSRWTVLAVQKIEQIHVGQLSTFYSATC